MTINLDSYYNYLNALSIDTTNNEYQNQNDISSMIGVKDSDNDINFDSCLLDMINNSQSAYEQIAQSIVVQETEGAASFGEAVPELYSNLNTILNSYQHLSNNSTYPSSLEESIFSMLTNTSSDKQENDITSSLLNTITGADNSSFQETASNLLDGFQQNNILENITSMISDERINANNVDTNYISSLQKKATNESIFHSLASIISKNTTI